MSDNKVYKVTYHVSCNLRSSNYCDLLILCEAQTPSAGSEAQRSSTGCEAQRASTGCSS